MPPKSSPALCAASPSVTSNHASKGLFAMTSNLQNPIFQEDDKAREWLEARVWPNGPICPHCGNADQEKITPLHGKAHRPGLYQCNEPECREQFTVTVKTVFERSKIPLSKWMAALFLLTASKKGVSSHQIHRSLDVSYKSAWFMMHRLREAIRYPEKFLVMAADTTRFRNRPRGIFRLEGPATGRAKAR
jgi:transposase-like protein